MRIFFSFLLLIVVGLSGYSQKKWIDDYNVVWNSQSKNSMQSMPCGGAGIGLNVWVEKNQVFILLGSSDSWLETPLREKPFEYVMRELAKLGRLCIQLPEEMFAGSFEQRTDLATNSILITGKNNEGETAKLRIWVDYYSPVVHIEGTSTLPIPVKAQLECWRGQCRFNGNAVEWGYRNDNDSLNSRNYYIESRQLQDMADVIPDLFTGLSFGGRLEGNEFKRTTQKIQTKSMHAAFDDRAQVSSLASQWPYSHIRTSKSMQSLCLETKKPCKDYYLQAVLRVAQDKSIKDFYAALKDTARVKQKTFSSDRKRTEEAWTQRWNQSYIRINPQADESDLGWQVGRNYQLFRAMLAVNNKGKFPTLFNGGLFTCLSDNPEYRNWDWSEYMAQNQRLVYWPMLRSGDYDLLSVALNFYKERTKVSEVWAKHFWGIEGHLYPEDMGAFGLPAYPNTKDGFSVPDCLTYHFTSGMEFALMMLEASRYSSMDIKPYLPSVIGILYGFDGFYRKENMKRTGAELNQNNQYVIYPGNGVELYTQTKNESATLAGLVALSEGLLALPEDVLTEKERNFVKTFRMRLPQLPHRVIRGHETIAPAESWKDERAAPNMELPHLYPVFPFGLYTLGRPDFELALDTWNYGYFQEEFQRRAFCWYQGGIFTARLGLAEQAREYAIAKFLYPLRQKAVANANGMDANLTPGRSRYPAFWDTGTFCEMPDMDHGGSAMVGLQEMLLQTELPGKDGYGKEYGKQIYLLPAWPKDWDVDFKLHAPYNTVVECSYVDGKIQKLKVTPEERLKDVIIMLK